MGIENEVAQRYETARGLSQNKKVSAIILETSNECRACACPGCYMVVSGRNRQPLQLINSEMATKIFDLVKAQNGGEEAKWLVDKGVFITIKLNIGNPNDPKQLEMQAKMIGKNVESAKKLVGGLYTALDAGLKNPQLSVENLIRGGKNSNVPLVPEYYELGLDLGFKPDIELMGNGETADWGYFALAPTIEQVRWIMEQIKGIQEKRGLEPITFLMPHITGSCPFYDTALYFQANGDIQPCSNNRTKLANLGEENAIAKTLESPVIQIRRNLTQSQISGPCGKCGIWTLCRGGCRATVESFGNPYGSYPLCGIQKEFDNAKDIVQASKK